jgi:hypothetical protein
MPLLSPSRACGSDPTTSKRRSEISVQFRSGGGVGKQTVGYEGSHSEPDEGEEEEELTTVVVGRPPGSPGCPPGPPSGSTGRVVVAAAVAVVTAKVGGVIDISTNSTSSTSTLIIGSEKQEYNPKRAYAKFLYGQTYQSELV